MGAGMFNVKDKKKVDYNPNNVMHNSMTVQFQEERDLVKLRAENEEKEKIAQK